MRLVKVSILSNNHDIQSDTRLTCIMLHKIDPMYRDRKHKETHQSSPAIQNLKSQVFSSSLHPDQSHELNLPDNPQEVSLEIQDIQLNPLQVWNCDDIEIDIN